MRRTSRQTLFGLEMQLVEFPIAKVEEMCGWNDLQDPGTENLLFASGWGELIVCLIFPEDTVALTEASMGNWETRYRMQPRMKSRRNIDCCDVTVVLVLLRFVAWFKGYRSELSWIATHSCRAHHLATKRLQPVACAIIHTLGPTLQAMKVLHPSQHL